MTYRTFTAVLVIAASLVIVTTGCAKKAVIAPVLPPTVSVAPVKLGVIQQSTPVVGALNTLTQTQLSAKLAGRVMWVGVHEGDAVRAGQVIVRLDPTEDQAAVNQDQANILDDLAKLAQAKTQYQQTVTNADVAVENAKSVLAASQVTLQKTVTGLQIEQKNQAKDQLLQQQANYDNALTSYNREKELYDQGAAAKADLDNAKTQLDVQKALLDNYQQAWNMAIEGGRSEDVKVAQDAVVQNKLALRNAIANLANVTVNRDAITAAQATVAQARAMLAQAAKQLSDLNITTPIDGYVSARSTDPGQLADVGTSLITIVNLRTVYFQPTLSDIEISAIHVGQSVAVAVDSFPGKTYAGKVSAVFPAASTTDRTFAIRVSIDNVNQELKPGMYARGNIVTAVDRGVVVVPLTALVPRNEQTGFTQDVNSTGTANGTVSLPPMAAFVYDNGTAVFKNVDVGIVQGQSAEVTQGLSPGDQLIVVGQQMLHDGDKVILPGQKQPTTQAAANGSAS